MKPLARFIILSLTILFSVGYILNIVALVHPGPVTGMDLVRLAGILYPPLGAIVGYF